MRRLLSLVAALALVAALGLLAPACSSSEARARGSAEVLRLGVFPTLTHAPAHVAIGTGILERALAPTRVEVRSFNSGTEAGIALLAGSIDASYMGPWPAISLYLQSGKVAIVSDATVGGASFVVRTGAGIAVPEDLHGKRIAVPNVGNTQDIALRTWLEEQGLEPTDEGGDVSITEADSAQLLELFRAGRVDGAWVPEPYPTYLIHEGVATLFVDEADLWPPGGFLTASLVVSTIYQRAHPEVVRRLVQANVDAIRFAQAQPLRAQLIAGRRLAWAGAPRIEPAVMADAWAKLAFTWGPVPAAIERVAQEAHALGILEDDPGPVLGVYHLDPLAGVLDDEGLPAVQTTG